MKVIVAGFPKTGTKSMDAALTQLGYKVYGHTENLFLLEKEWTKILNYDGKVEDFKAMYEDVDAVTDVPACYFWEEILMSFPDAKIILTQRESEDAWFRSLMGHMKTFQNNFMINLLKTTSPTQWRLERNVSAPTTRLVLGFTPPGPWTSKITINESLAKKRYRAHNAHVMQNAPKDQLLLYKVSDGWEPLCKFLGVPVPDAPFPHKNKRGNIAKDWLDTDPLLQQMKREMFLSLSLAAAAVSYATYKIATNPGVFKAAFCWVKDSVSDVLGKFF